MNSYIVEMWVLGAANGVFSQLEREEGILGNILHLRIDTGYLLFAAFQYMLVLEEKTAI